MLLLFFLAIIPSATSTAGKGGTGSPTGDSNKRVARRKSIVLLITDDQDIQLGSMEFMPKTLRIFRQRGVEFRNAFVTTPICCPSRSTILSGLYAHNHNVMTNNQNCAGAHWREQHEKATIGVPLQRAGYRTGYFGKYLNDYDGSWMPPGWDQWTSLMGNSRYYNYSLKEGQEVHWHGFDYEEDYLTDLVANASMRFIQECPAQQPFFAVLSFPAPHGPEDPAPQFANLFQGVDTHRTESWNYAPNPDKQWLLQRTGKMEPVHVAFTDQLHRRRLQTLQSVDDAVERLVQLLRSEGRLQSTYLLYTSDHGYHLGQFGLIKGKAMPYEFDIRVPFFLRGPAIPRGKAIHSLVANIDIGPTILAMAGLADEQQKAMDGCSLLELAERGEDSGGLDWRDTVLIERGKMPIFRRIRDRLLDQRKRMSKELRLARECAKLKYRKGCGSPGQQWECVRSPVDGGPGPRTAGGRWRIQKCRSQSPVGTRTSSEVEGASCLCRKRRTAIAEEEEENEDEREEELETEEEFLLELHREEVLGSGQWYQGVFADEEGDIIAAGEKRTTNQQQRRRERDLFAGRQMLLDPAEFLRDDGESQLTMIKGGEGDEDNATAIHNKRMKMTRNWATRLRSRIRKFRRKLTSLKNLRKRAKTNEALAPEQCRCDAGKGGQKEHNHPLRRNSKKEGQRRRSSPAPRDNCHQQQMNCFEHSADHWRTPPLWPREFGRFCFCQNANNNSYWCLRTVNATHDFLYCEFVTEEVVFFDLSADPHQLVNIVHSMPENLLDQLSGQLQLLKSCRGNVQCEQRSSSRSSSSATKPTLGDDQLTDDNHG